MKLCVLFSIPLLSLASPAQQAEPPRELLVAAVGEIPVPKLKVVTIGEFTGYTPDMESTNQWFPQEWKVAGQAIKLNLNHDPVVVKVPGGDKPFSLSAEGAADKPQKLPETAAEQTTMMIIYNRDFSKPWKEGFATRFVRCAKLNHAEPSALVLNLSGADVTTAGLDQKIQHIAPGNAALAAILKDPYSDYKLLPLAAVVSGETYSLNILPLEVRSPWCPVVVVYPSSGPGRMTRPLQVGVIQPAGAEDSSK